MGLVDNHELTTTSPEDIIVLNVGGEVMTTTRGTLTQVPGTMLASMFSGRWESGVSRDEAGRVFLDYDPRHFRAILNHLRGRRINRLEAAEIWEDRLAVERELSLIWSYLGRREDSRMCPQEPFVFLEGPNTRVSNQGTKVTAPIGHPRWVSILAEPSIRRGRCYFWKCKLEALSYQSVLVGIIGVLQPGSSSHEHPTSYCWYGGGWQFVRGQYRLVTGDWEGLHEGDEPSFRLDLTRTSGGVLSMWVPRTRQLFSMNITDDLQRWYVHVRLQHPNSMVWILPLSAEEKQVFHGEHLGVEGMGQGASGEGMHCCEYISDGHSD